MKETNKLFIEEAGGIVKIVQDFLITSDMMSSVQESIAKQKNQLREELNELMSAISAQDKKETFDGIGDVGFVILSLEILGESQELMRAFLRGVVYSLGLDSDTMFGAVEIAAVSNLSKFDTSTEGAADTQAYYKDLGIETKVSKVNGLFVTTVSESTEVDGKPYHAGKVLKSRHNFVDADWEGFMEDYIVSYEITKSTYVGM